MTFLFFHSGAACGQVFRDAFARELPDLPYFMDPSTVDPDAVRYLITWTVPENLARHRNLEVLFSTGAGEDQFITASVPEHVKIVPMVEEGIVRMMQEYAVLGVLVLHRNLPAYLQQQRAEAWKVLPQPQTGDRRIGILGLCNLGQAVLDRLEPFSISIAGWSRSERSIDGVRCYSGAAGLKTMLAETDILICLLPLTDGTRGFLNVDIFNAMPNGAGVVQVGRGPQLDRDELLLALDDGQLSAAVIDVTDPEPLSAGHPFWRHEKILLTPHIASVTHLIRPHATWLTI